MKRLISLFLLIIFNTSISLCMQTEPMQTEPIKIDDQFPLLPDELVSHVLDLSCDRTDRYTLLLSIIRCMRVNKQFKPNAIVLYDRQLNHDGQIIEAEQRERGKRDNGDDTAWTKFVRQQGAEKGMILIALEKDLLFWMHHFLKNETRRNRVVNEHIRPFKYPLHVVIDKNSKLVFQLLLKTEVNLDQVEGTFNFIPFQYALQNNRDDMALKLAQAEFENNPIDPKKLKQLHEIALKSNRSVASFISDLLTKNNIALNR